MEFIAKRVGFIVFDGVTALDLVGPAEAFAAASVDSSKGGTKRAYEIVTLGRTRAPCVTEAGLTLTPSTTLEQAGPLDTLIVPGGSGLRRPEVNGAISRWIKRSAGQFRRIASVCTGIYGLAPTGLLDGRRVTTHWQFVRDVARQFPALRVEPDALFVKDGAFYTAAGITAGIDLALSLIEEDLGPTTALAVARELVVYMKRPGGQEQFSQPLRFQVDSSDRFADLTAWMTAHLQADLSVESLARRVALSSRQFSRQFKAAFGQGPADFVRLLRLEEARRRLVGRRGIKQVAAAVGFASDDAFRRAFEGRFGISPSAYRARFSS
jgi:transcriptional regulator GlxA family with amidase domain